MHNDIAKMEQHLINGCGYDKARVSFKCESLRMHFEFFLEDDFQSAYDNNSYKVGFQSTDYIDVAEDEDFLEACDEARSRAWMFLTELPTRELRELHYLMGRAGSAIEAEKYLIGIAGREFVESLKQTRAQYAGLLTSPNAVRDEE